MANVGLLTVDSLEYNGYTFGGAHHIEVQSEKVRDEANRTVIYHQFRITVSAIIAPDAGTSTDGAMDAIHNALSHDGGQLLLSNSGFGTILNVNRAGGKKDVKWGPKTEILTWEPVGSNSACEVVWTCTTCIPVCEGSTLDTGIMAMNYEVAYDINEHGDTTRTISGYYEIAQTRGPNKQIPDCADRDIYRNQVVFECPAGFKRNIQWRNSKDRSRQDFTITDVQIPSPNAYPKFVTHIDGQHNMHWYRGSKGTPATVTCRLRMSITPKSTISGEQAWVIFLTVLQKRLKRSAQVGVGSFIQSITCTENLWGRACEFECEYRIYPGDVLYHSIEKFIEHGGLFSPLEFNWTEWKDSLADGPRHPRGNAKLETKATDDKIVDLCSRASVAVNSQPSQEAMRSGSKISVKNEMPSPEGSYLDYRATIIPEREASTVRHQILQQSETTTSPPSQLQETTFKFPNPGGTDDVIQQRGRSSYQARYIGYARRVGYPVARPALTRIGGQAAVEVEGKFALDLVGVFFGVPVFFGAWNILYALANSPAEVSPPPLINIPQGAVSNGSLKSYFDSLGAWYPGP